MIRRVCSKVCDFLVTNGGYYLVLAILFVGTMLAAPMQMDAALLFNIAEGLALVTIALVALRTWKKTEHWKVKKEAFLILYEYENQIDDSQVILSDIYSRIQEFTVDLLMPEEYTDYKTYVINELSDIENSLKEKVETTPNRLTKNLKSCLSAIDITWANKFTNEVRYKIILTLRDSDSRPFGDYSNISIRHEISQLKLINDPKPMVIDRLKKLAKHFKQYIEKAEEVKKSIPSIARSIEISISEIER